MDGCKGRRFRRRGAGGRRYKRLRAPAPGPLTARPRPNVLHCWRPLYWNSHLIRARQKEKPLYPSQIYAKISRTQEARNSRIPDSARFEVQVQGVRGPGVIGVSHGCVEFCSDKSPGAIGSSLAPRRQMRNSQGFIYHSWPLELFRIHHAPRRTPHRRPCRRPTSPTRPHLGPPH